MKALKILAFLAALAVIGGAGFVYSGVYPIGADAPHWPITFKFVETLRERSIEVRARNIEVPPDLADPERVRRGAGNYDAMCAGCHLKPGVKDSEIRKGLYPQPPNLAVVREPAAHEPADAASRAAARQFWTIKHGIKLTGMPAWSRGGMDDAAIWDLVALLQKLPETSPEEYAALVAASEGHSHGEQQKSKDNHEGHNHAH
jgi:mono/diheme cytochrome c family protein